MSTWPAVITLDDIEHMPLRPFNPDEFPTRRDPALDAEKTTEQLLAEVRAVRPDLAKLAALTADTDEFIDGLHAMVADVEQVTGHTIRRAA